ncbi:hypothetical protein ACFY1P_21755 [Streptomyces sp. NPDC001407]|uniref:hypothetical protein n=1 Tax=unclassified Streptomyces TaxID=2593676 RepID=UPI00367372A9
MINAPLEAAQIPDGTALLAFNNAYRLAKNAGVPFVAVEYQRRKEFGIRKGWTAKTDLLTAALDWPSPSCEPLWRAALCRLVLDDTIAEGSGGTTGYTVLWGIGDEATARAIAAAFHAALYGQTQALSNIASTGAP